MRTAIKLVFAAAILAAIVIPAAASGKQEAKSHGGSVIQTKQLLAAKPEAKPEAG